jgi:hypothetical protein
MDLPPSRLPKTLSATVVGCQVRFWRKCGVPTGSGNVRA